MKKFLLAFYSVFLLTSTAWGAELTQAERIAEIDSNISAIEAQRKELVDEMKPYWSKKELTEKERKDLISAWLHALGCIRQRDRLISEKEALLNEKTN